ncbi:hypothetical protein Pedsa_0415 [Pseudopedobacter saltans DSM 12145]|uniref:Prolyl-tRNA synthetase n=1 Tax=Pseudopedobacter saltans (strain ATCC 51119 / DSM 12145 / JCM 21818 / CCUG 39354 / LMG 10337 / NBRC 100064 / NCIMB 13643) TaxID=762903 RepID=F0S5S6_PSESL|nr:hypothetical protein [Pseudopedobacter saltans]ADY50997.1 hypothetical protein Pedsa_0415 [Pseudopedobacter saltans DSM 12145]
MKTKITHILLGSFALVLASCATSQTTVQNASSGDDVYSSNVEAKKITYTPRRIEDYQTSNGNDYYYDEDQNESRIDINRRAPYSWRDSYYDNYLSYDPFYYDPFYSNSWYRPGFSVGLGWNNWGWNSWSIGWNNWGYDPFYYGYGWNSWYYNPWAYNPWYGPYRYNYWGMYSVYNPVYWGGGYYGGLWNGRVVENNPRPSRGVSGVRPDRTGSSSGRVGTNTRSGGRIQMPEGRPSRTEGTVGRPGTSERPGTTRPMTRPESGQSGTRPTRSEAPQRVERPAPTESSRPQSRPERYSPPPQQSPSSWGGGSSSSGGGSSRGSSGGGGGRPSR